MAHTRTFERNQTVTVKASGLQDFSGPISEDGVEYRVEGYWDEISGGSWMDAAGNPAALNYAMRSAFAGLPLDNEVLYGKIGAFGHLIHVSEIVE